MPPHGFVAILVILFQAGQGCAWRPWLVEKLDCQEAGAVRVPVEEWNLIHKKQMPSEFTLFISSISKTLKKLAFMFSDLLCFPIQNLFARKSMTCTV